MTIAAFIIGVGCGLVLGSYLPRGRLDERGLNDVVNQMHNEIAELRSDLAHAFVRIGRLEDTSERRDAA